MKETQKVLGWVFGTTCSRNSTLLGTAIISSTEGNASGAGNFGVSLDLGNSSDNYMIEVQHLYQGGNFNLQSGGGFVNADETDWFRYLLPFESYNEEYLTTKHVNIYSYGQVGLPYNTTATLGLSGDLLDSPVKDREEINPKFGLTWQPQKSTIVRAAIFKNMQRRLIYAQTVEPTQVAGFNQFFDDDESSIAWTYGIALDQIFSNNFYGGLQFFHRDLDVPSLGVTLLGETYLTEDDWQENISSAYLYWVPRSWTTLGLEYYYERYTHDQFEGLQGYKNLTSHRLTPMINLFHPSGISAEILASYVNQKGEFGVFGFGFEEGRDSFWVVDLSISYRLPKRYGVLKLEAKNLFNKKFRYLNTESGNPRFLPESQIMASLTISF